MPNNIVKNQQEISYIRRAAQIIDYVYDRVLATVKAGVTERELADFILNTAVEAGASGVSFDTIVAFGSSGAEPHHIPSYKKLEKGMLVTVDMGALYEGYCSDFTRTFAFGTPDDEQKRIYDIVYESQKLAMAAVANGAKCFDVDKVARDVISAAGYGEYYVHGTGHGVGQLIHEAPTLNARSEEILKNDMVVTIEPGIYLPDKMGVRIEDMTVVGVLGALSRHATELIVLDA